MTTLPRFDETEVTVTEGVIKIAQRSRNYSTATIEIPTIMWATFQDAVDKALDDEFISRCPPTSTDLAGEAFHLLQAMNKAKLEEMEADLPAHKRQDYAEKMYEMADDARKALRENFSE